MSKTATAKEEAAAEVVADDKAKGRLCIMPAMVISNHAERRGNAWGEFMVRLPEGLDTMDAVLHEPDLWRGIQSNGATALLKMDRLRLVAFDESWVADAVISEADNKSISLAEAGIRVIELPARVIHLPEIDDYRVKYYGHGYAVERKKDHHRMTEATQDLKQATMQMHNLVPKPGDY